VNSVLGARTERYGDFLDACCAISGRAPFYGLHKEENRRARVVVDVSRVPASLKARDVFFPVLGTWLGLEVGQEIAAIVGLPESVTRDQLKALGAAAASTGAVALFHVVGVTPEAPTLEAVSGGEVLPLIEATPDKIMPALERLSTAHQADGVDAIAVGSPHFSLDEFDSLRRFLSGRHLSIPFYVCTARGTLRTLDERGHTEALRSAGVEIIADTCVVVTPILPAVNGVLMTNSGKFAHYGPSNTGYEVLYGSLEDCVESGVQGRVVRDAEVWSW
jgi:predicted aconitase